MGKSFSEEIFAEKLSNLSTSQSCIQTLSRWCISHHNNAEEIVAVWDKHLTDSDTVHTVPLLYLANDILQINKSKGYEFDTVFWKVLPSALKEVVKKGNNEGRQMVSRLIRIWKEREVFGSYTQGLEDAMLGDELLPSLEQWKKRSHSDRNHKKDKRFKLSNFDGTTEKIVSAFQLVLSECSNEDEEMNKCKSSVDRMKKIEKDVDIAKTKAKEPSWNNLAKGLEEEENILKKCIDKLKLIETNRLALISQLRDAIYEQESQLEKLRTQIEEAEARIEEASNKRKCLDNEASSVDSKPLNTSTDSMNAKAVEKSTAEMAAELADKLVASSSSHDIMTSVLAAYAAKNPSLMTMSSYQSESQACDYTNPNPPPPSMQYMHPSSGIVGPVYGVRVSLPHLTRPTSYMVGPTTSSAHQYPFGSSVHQPLPPPPGLLPPARKSGPP